MLIHWEVAMHTDKRWEKKVCVCERDTCVLLDGHRWVRGARWWPSRSSNEQQLMGYVSVQAV